MTNLINTRHKHDISNTANNSCPGCSDTENGYLISFPTQNAAHDCCSLLPLAHACEWRYVDDKNVWISERLLHSVAKIIEENQSTKGWSYVAAKRKGASSCSVSSADSYSDLRAAIPDIWVDSIIREDRLKMMYQPIVDVSSGFPRVFAYELLARGIEKSGEIIPPVKMFDSAREQNRMLYLDSACRVEAVKATRRIKSTAKAFINFVPTAINSPDHCLQSTFNTAKEFKVPASQLVFEVVETEKILNIDHLRRIFDIYRKQGVLCALDDVGQGNNTEDLIHLLKPDIVKLDRSITSTVIASFESANTANRIRKATEKYNGRCLAEGIETEAEARALTKIGYFWHQGYYYGKPSWDPIEIDHRATLSRAA